MILGVQLVGVLVTEGVGEQVHPGPRVEHLKSLTENWITLVFVQECTLDML